MAEKKTSSVNTDPGNPFSYYDGLYGSGDLGKTLKGHLMVWHRELIQDILTTRLMNRRF